MDYKVAANVFRDDIVDGWRINGKKVCVREPMSVPPGCYVLGVEYGVRYNRRHRPRDPSMTAHEGGEAREFPTNHPRYGSELPFVVHVRPGMRYFVTAMFNGERFFPYITETDQAGTRLGQIQVATSREELAACRAASPLR